MGTIKRQKETNASKNASKKDANSYLVNTTRQLNDQYIKDSHANTTRQLNDQAMHDKMKAGRDTPLAASPEPIYGRNYESNGGRLKKQ
jgi:hypothetical protein